MIQEESKEFRLILNRIPELARIDRVSRDNKTTRYKINELIGNRLGRPT
jgi:hypothetical protein